MSCPTCDHTMGGVGNAMKDGSAPVFHCDRCGTVVQKFITGENVYVPKLVERCREFEKTLPPGNPPSVSYSREWHRLGIAESINKPEDRPCV